MVWLDAPAEGAARAGELCERHARGLSPPRGWLVSDRRHEATRLRDALHATTPLLDRAFRSAGVA
jgi:hypothetical protein